MWKLLKKLSDRFILKGNLFVKVAQHSTLLLYLSIDEQRKLHVLLLRLEKAILFYTSIDICLVHLNQGEYFV